MFLRLDLDNVSPRIVGLIVVAAALAAPRTLVAQGSAVEFASGPWWYGESPAFSYTLAYHQRIAGPVDYGLGFAHLDDASTVDDRTQTGAVVSLAVNRAGPGPYVRGAWGLGLRHTDRDPDAFWALGLGYSLRPATFLSLGLEALYRVEDQSLGGFWQLDPTDRRGVQLQGRVALAFGGQPRRARTPRRAPARRPSATSTSGPSDDTSPAATTATTAANELTLDVVATALEAMGAPYRWGGSDANGYDCSGLIQYAYGEHGILLPRRSRDQARTGDLVDPDVVALQPGDILGFTTGGGGISHVGLYVGHGDFIHSTSGGVKISSLTSDDPDSRWWQERWVNARRVLP